MKDILKKKLTPELFAEVEKALGDDFDYVPRSRLNEVIGQRENFKKEIDDYKGQIAKLEEDVKQTDTWKTKYETESQNWAAEKTKIQREHSINSKLTEKKARNLAAVTALIDMTKVGEDLKGLDSELERIIKDAPYLFGDEIPGGTGKKTPGDPGNKGGDTEADLERRRRAVLGMGGYR